MIAEPERTLSTSTKSQDKHATNTVSKTPSQLFIVEMIVKPERTQERLQILGLTRNKHNKLNNQPSLP